MKIISNNKKAFHDYYILTKYEAGIELFGSEVKSVREGRINLKDSFCKIKDREVFLFNVHISPYTNASIFNHEPERIRKLLLHKNEILKLRQRIKEESLTLIPLKVYITEKGLIKIELGLAKGKQLHDKRDTLAKRDFERKVKKDLKYNY